VKRLTATTVVLAMCLLGCASFAPRGEQVPLPTEPGVNRLTGGGVLMNRVIDVEAHPTTGTPIIWNDMSEMRWPEGFTAWRVGSQVEVLDTFGNVVLVTGRRYKFHTSTFIGHWIISDVDECPDCELGFHLE
jgi:hypothetical protein